MSRSLTRALFVLGVSVAVSACSGDERVPNTNNTNNTNNNNTTNNNTGGLTIDAFTASAASVASGGSVTLSWKISGADSVTVTIEKNPGSPVIEGDTRLEGSIESGAITEDTTFTLSATGNGETKSTSVTVTIDADEVQILAFTATPNPAPATSTVTLSWQTAGATRITILEGTTELHTDTAAQGAFAVQLSEAVHVYTLRADNDVMSTSAMVTVETQTPGSITTFAVSPGTFTGASADVTVTFAGQGETFTLTANGSAVAGYNGEAAGNLTVTVTETTLFVFTAEGAGVSDTAQAAVAQAVGEMEPNDDAGTATPLTGGAEATLSSATDVDFYSFMVPAGGNVFAQISDGMGGCNFPALLTLHDSNGAITDTFFAIEDCPSIDPAQDAAAVDLPAGVYYVSVEAADETFGDYALAVVVGNAGCGNGLLEASTSEQCDDGNTADGDGCSSTCTVENAGSVSGIDQDQTFAGAIVPEAASDFYEVVLPSEGYITAETGVPVLGSCVDPADTIVSLLDSSFAVLDENDDTFDALCGNLEAFAGSTYPAGTYYVRVAAYPGSGAISAYEVRIQTLSVGCGNGIAETGEQCDDGNTMDGDGCSAACALERAGSVSGAGGTVSLNLGAAMEFPRFVEVTVTAGQSVTATTTGPNNGPCPFETLLGLFDDQATVQYGLVGGNGGCAFIDPAIDTWAANLAAGTYLLGVATAAGPGGAVDLTVAINDAVCGNRLLEDQAGEQCDDGNTMDGDGCSSMCQFEGSITTEVEPNNDSTTANALGIAPGGAAETVSGAVDPVGDVDYWSFTIASGTASLVASTYPVFGDPTSCDFDMDTLLELYDAQGNLVATNDDDGNRTGFCSLLDSTSDPAAGMLAAGTYYLVVRYYDDTQLVPQYFMDVSLTTP